MTDVSPNPGAATIPSNPEAARDQLATWLRQARERSGISIEAVSQETRISKNYILSLESGNLDGLPGKVFGRGFVKNITRLLRTDTNEGLKLYDACWESAVIAPASDEANEHKLTTQTEVQKPKKEVQARYIESETGTPKLVQKLPSRRRSVDARYSIKMPAWLVHAAVSPHIRLWVLTGLATVFVGLVFGRWAAGTLHKNRLATKSNATASSVKDSSADDSLSAPLPAMDSERESLKNVGLTSAVSDSDRQVALPASSATQNKITGAAVMSTSERANADNAADQAASVDDNPLYMPSGSPAAFEQVVEVRVSGDVDIKLTMDGKKVDRTKFGADSYRFTFNDRAELHLGDASLVDVIYNGKSLGSLGNKGRRRRIVLQAKASLDDFPQ